MTVFGYLIIIRVDFYDFISVFSLVSVSIKKIYQTLMAAFNHISKHFRLLLWPGPNILNFVKNTLLSYFQLSCQCLEMWPNMVFCVRYITSPHPNTKFPVLDAVKYLVFKSLCRILLKVNNIVYITFNDPSV